LAPSWYFYTPQPGVQPHLSRVIIRDTDAIFGLDMKNALILALVFGLHNLPESIVVAVPLLRHANAGIAACLIMMMALEFGRGE